MNQVQPQAQPALGEEIESRYAATRALSEATEQGIAAKAVTPFLLDRIFALTAGRSLSTNIALVRGNARLAAAIAQELVQLPATASK